MKSKHSFTLIELLIVLVIIGILATLAMPQYEAFVWKARFAEVYNIVGMVSRAEEAYRVETGDYTRFVASNYEVMAGHPTTAGDLSGYPSYDGSVTKVQQALGITIPSGCYFTYLIYPCVEFPEAYSIYFKQPGLNWAWAYNYKDHRWWKYDTGVDDGGPARKYFQPPS